MYVVHVNQPIFIQETLFISHVKAKVNGESFVTYIVIFHHVCNARMNLHLSEVVQAVYQVVLLLKPNQEQRESYCRWREQRDDGLCKCNTSRDISKVVIIVVIMREIRGDSSAC